MIVRNEQDVLMRGLSSASRLVDEIIVVDTGSLDNTKEIAQQFTDKVLDFEWIDDFSAARNFAFSQATKDYILWLDADDVITDENAEKFLRLKNDLPQQADTVFMKYDVAYDQQGAVTFSYYRERLVRNCDKAKWVDPVHEVIVPFGQLHYSDVAISHRKEKSAAGGRNLAIYEKHIASGGVLSARMKYYYARELMYNNKYNDAIDMFENFLSDESGWVENKIDACRNLYNCHISAGHGGQVHHLFRSLELDTPRAEILCDIGYYFLEKGALKTAEYWYLSALNRKTSSSNLGFTQKEYYGFIPAIQLCVVYDKLGDKEKAMHYNELAGAIKPYDKNYLSNREYLLH